MKKKIFASLFSIITVIIVSSFSSTYATINEIRNFVNGAENGIENFAGGAVNTIRNGTNTMSNTMDNFINNTTDMMNMENNQNSFMGTTTNTSGNYTATRTAATVDTVTFAGMSIRTWTFIIIAVTLIGIGVIVWSYMNQRNHNRSNYYDE